MTADHQPSRNLTQKQVLCLQKALRNIDALIDPQNPQCSLEPERKRQIEPYIRTYVKCLIEEALDGRHNFRKATLYR